MTPETVPAVFDLDEAPSALNPKVQDPIASVILNADNLPWHTEQEAANEFRMQDLKHDTWTVARAPGGEGFCLMTFRHILELQRHRDQESMQRASLVPKKYWKIKVLTSADPLKQDQVSHPVLVNGELKVLFLNHNAIIEDSFLECLNNSVRPNLVPKTGRPDGDMTEAVGWRGRINFSVIGEATEAEWQAYRANNKDRFERFQIERSKEPQQRPT